MIWVGLAILSALSMWRNWRLGLVFLISVTLTGVVNMYSLPFEFVWFSAIYTCIGAAAFFFFERVAGAFLCMIGASFVLQASGYIPEHTRDIVGEALFVVGLVAGAIIGPSGGVSNRLDLLVGSLRNRHHSIDSIFSADFEAPRVGGGDGG